MKVHMHTKFCLICLLTFIFHHCNHCHEEHDHGSEEHHRHHRGMTESESSKFSVLDAENEKKYYIEKLFDRYGENGRLSFFGLEKLLTNLGLGEIKVVEINHEDLGHDHVSHLDILAVQEGKHFHSHNHQHSHSHLNSENQTVTSVSTKRSHKCDPEKETIEVSVKSDDKHMHDRNHRLCHHHCLRHHLDHNTTRHFPNDSIIHSEHGEPSHEPSTETNKTQEQSESKLLKGKKKRKGKKSNENSEVITPGFPPNHDQGEQYEHNRVHKPDRVHNPGHFHVRLPEHNGHDPGHGHQDLDPDNEGELRHTRKREAPHVKKSAIYAAASHKDHNEDDRQHECLNVTQLLKYYGHRANSPISPDLFTYLCPALLYQIDSRLCIEHFDRLLVEDLNKDKNLVPEDKANIGASAWICGIISITVISLLSLLGVILVPIINQGCFKFLLTFLVALAVGTMSGDALLHLLPHSQGGHDHSHQHAHGHGHSHGHESKKFLEEYDAVLKGLVALGGIYLLFIIEHCIRMFKHYKQQRGKQKWFMKQNTEESAIGRKLSDHKLNNTPDADWLQLKPLAGTDDSVVSEDRLNETELTDLEGQQESPPKNYLCIEEEKIMAHSQSDGLPAIHEHDLHAAAHNHHDESKTVLRKHNHQWHHKHSHHSHGPCHSGSDLKETGIANIAWMVIMGDGIHNFSDGLAIGAAFSAGLTGGISTSIAVFCHELPHELGDFAVLLKAGMTVKQAIVYNLLSAMMAYIGMLIGTAVGQYANNITLWIFAITAGMFLYVALVDMLPEMLHGDGDNEEHGFCPVGQFILQNLGLLFGFAIMLVIALYEDKIVFDLQF
ncbi:zinc transporter ZIP10 isoform X1 [Orcinus orca]|uniref:zinc transporter ZIP10 isoform X1 n=1 Tax=Orcinus orca TaxID=9733 RepID=UPI0002BCE7CC|nr:zinc transporter ZIP10 isoform X1 [Orcinus orca]XP_033256207.1 zinc transporter ZIP10 isoform X1 [Orcinus orca]XP_033256208.1 zinc transporter ZIP10 isoform X1 [Orcinus orca]XP_049568097.1 zinc transporter ZIP10 isoform X1 [Orcinus orca]